MKLNNSYRAEIEGNLDGSHNDQWDRAIRYITEAWNKQHNGDDSHGAVTANSLDVSGDTAVTNFRQRGIYSCAGSGTEAAKGAIPIPQITADQNDWNPRGLYGGSMLTAHVLFIASDAARNITGLINPQSLGIPLLSQHIWVTLFNIGGFNITLKHASVSSAAANRFALPNSADVVIRVNGGVRLLYRPDAQRWFCEQP